MSLLSTDEALGAGIGADLDTDALQAAIDEEEAWLARRIGPLTGERTQRYPLAYLRPTTGEVRLRRPTDAVEVLSEGTDISDAVELRRDGWRVGLLPRGDRYTGAAGTGVLEITYTPNDELEVKRAVKQLLAMQLGTVTGGGVTMEQMDGYMYQRGAGVSTRSRASIVASLREPAEAGSTRLHSSLPHGVATALGRP